MTEPTTDSLWQMVEGMPQIVWIAAPNGEVVYYNRKWYDYTGEDPKAPQPWRYYIHPEDLPNAQERWQHAVESKQPAEFQLRIRNVTGEYQWFLTLATPVHRGDTLDWIGTSTNIDATKKTQEALAFLDEASRILASSLNYEETLRRVAALAVPAIGDWCGVDILNEEGQLERLATAHVDPEKVKWAKTLQEKFPVDMNAPTGVPQVLRTGRSEFYPDITEEMLRASIHDEEQMEIMHQIGFTSVIIVPLVAREVVFGAISLVTAEGKRRYTETDLRLAEDLGRRAGIAIDNSWLYTKAQREIAEREQTESALRESEQHLRLSETRFRTMIEQSPLGIQLFDREGFCIQANRAWEVLWGAKLEDLRGYNVLQDPQLHQNGFDEYIRRAYEGEAVAFPPIHYDPERTGRPGRPRWIRAFAYPVKSEDQNIQEVALILEDVTERRNAEDELRKAKELAEANEEQLRTANQAKDRFLAILSHELRTPLTPVMATVQALQAENTSEELRPWLEIIERNVELEARLIDDLLDLTRITKGKLQLNSEHTDIHRILHNVVEIYRHDLQEKDLRLTITLKAKHSETIGDPARIQQVFWNITRNAIKFTPRSGQILIHSENAINDGGKEVIRIEISDTGIGIEPDVLGRIFEPFEQGESTVTRHFGGLGLGLAISKNLVELHHGSLTAISPGKGQGATFIVEFLTAEALHVESAQQHPKTTNIDSSGSTVMLVDDHVDTSLAVRLLLERQGYKVVVANSAGEAIELARKVPFDLVISDIGLPDESGLTLLPKLKAIRNVPAIALSGFGTEDDVERSREAGFNEHIIKPFNLTGLRQTIDRLLKRP